MEATESRKDSQLARECLLALPTELSLEQQINLVEKFFTDQFVQHGMVADLALHSLALHSLEENPHVHILLTMRDLKEDGFGLKNRDWNQRSWLKDLQKSWADYCTQPKIEAALRAKSEVVNEHHRHHGLGQRHYRVHQGRSIIEIIQL